MSITASEWNVLAKWLFESYNDEESEIVDQLFQKYPALRSDLATVNESITWHFYTTRSNMEKLYQKTTLKLKTSAS